MRAVPIDTIAVGARENLTLHILVLGSYSRIVGAVVRNGAAIRIFEAAVMRKEICFPVNTTDRAKRERCRQEQLCMAGTAHVWSAESAECETDGARQCDQRQHADEETQRYERHRNSRGDSVTNDCPGKRYI